MKALLCFCSEAEVLQKEKVLRKYCRVCTAWRPPWHVLGGSSEPGYCNHVSRKEKERACAHLEIRARSGRRYHACSRTRAGRHCARAKLERRGNRGGGAGSALRRESGDGHSVGKAIFRKTRKKQLGPRDCGGQTH